MDAAAAEQRAACAESESVPDACDQGRPDAGEAASNATERRAALEEVMSEPEHIWETVDRERLRCTRHDVTWHRTADTFRVGPETFAHGICPLCSACPLRGDIAMPDYWKPTTMGTRGEVPALSCSHHDCVFDLDAACRACVEEDMGREVLEQMLAASREGILSRARIRSQVGR